MLWEKMLAHILLGPNCISSAASEGIGWILLGKQESGTSAVSRRNGMHLPGTQRNGHRTSPCKHLPPPDQCCKKRTNHI